VDGTLEVEMFEAFELILKLTVSTVKNENETVQNVLANVKSGDWWRFLDAFCNHLVNSLIGKPTCL
jgi:hypothetical protein